MARRPRRCESDPRQGALFSPNAAREPAKGSLNFDRELRAAMAEAVKQSGKPREVIAEEMEELLGSDPDYPISKALLDAWTAPSRSDWRFPVIYLPAFISVTGADWLLDRLAERCGRIAIGDEEARDMEIGRLQRRVAADQRRVRDLLKSAVR